MITLAWFMILCLILAYARVQLWKGREMQKLALAQAIKTRTTPAPRGLIFDRNSNKLVDNKRTLHLVIQHEDLPKDNQQIEALAMALQIDPDQLKHEITAVHKSSGNRMMVIQDNLDDAGITRAETLRVRFPFLSIEMAPRRIYLGGDLTGHAIGYVGEVTMQDLAKKPERYQLGEIIGRSGFEAARNDQLKGTDGQCRILVDSLGREVVSYNIQEVKSGRNAYLTLDIGLQMTLKKAFGQLQGAGIVLDLRDGGVLALYSNPSYDPNIFLNKLTQEQVKKFWGSSDRPMLNRVTQGRYSPASTFKLLVALCALEKGIITPNTTIVCHGHKNFYNQKFRCDGIHGKVNLIQAIAHSCDIYFYEIATRLDIDDIYNTAKKYGVTELTGIDLPHEALSRVPNRAWKQQVKKEKWFLGETISVSIGQGATSLTPIALARFYAMIATRGKLLTPHLLYGFSKEGTNDIDLCQFPAPRDTGLPYSIWTILDEGLYQVVHSGTARASALSGITMVGKTGTSQVTTFVNKAHYANLAKKLKDNALFAGYAPRENPQIAFAIVAENAGFGSRSAAPIARKICQYWLIDRLKKPLLLPTTKSLDAFQINIPKLEKNNKWPQ